MKDHLRAMVVKEGGGSAGTGKRPGPARRPAFTAHPALCWSPDKQDEHCADCYSGRDEAGEWKPWPELTDGERWARFHEYSITECGMPVYLGPTREVTVP